MGRVVHFEIHAEDTERAVAFCRNVFGWNFNPWQCNDYWMIETGLRDEPGIDGGLLPRRGEIVGNAVLAFICTIDVDALDATMSAVQENGGSIALEKQPVPSVGWLAYGKDTEGNIFGMMQSDADAA